MVPVEVRHCECRESESVGREGVIPVLLQLVEPHQPGCLRIFLAGGSSVNRISASPRMSFGSPRFHLIFLDFRFCFALTMNHDSGRLIQRSSAKALQPRHRGRESFAGICLMFRGTCPASCCALRRGKISTKKRHREIRDAFFLWKFWWRTNC